MSKEWTLYILRLDKGKYYIGITSKTPTERFAEHKLNIRAAYWTMQYPPQEIIYTEKLGCIEKLNAEKRENKMVRACIKKYGVNNVRGGDLRDTKDYIIRFGRIIVKEDWTEIRYVLILLLFFFAFLIDKYYIAFIPGGVR